MTTGSVPKAGLGPKVPWAWARPFSAAFLLQKALLQAGKVSGYSNAFWPKKGLFWPILAKNQPMQTNNFPRGPGYLLKFWAKTAGGF